MPIHRHGGGGDKKIKKRRTFETQRKISVIALYKKKTTEKHNNVRHKPERRENLGYLIIFIFIKVINF